MNLVCPSCGEKLVAQKLGKGMAWGCTGCEGKAVNLTILKNISNPEAISDFWMAVKHSSQTDDRKCPACKKSMRVYTAAELGGIEVDVCVVCQFLWFDKSELEQVPRATPQEIEEREKSEKSNRPSPPPRTEDWGLLTPFPHTRHRSFMGALFDFFFWI